MKAFQLYEQAKLAEASGDLINCVKILEKCLLINPDYADAWDTRASSILRLGDPFYAMMNYNRAISLNPKADYYVNRGHAYGELGEYDKAFADYDKAIELNPKFSMPYANKANIQRVEKQLEFAETNYRTAIKYNPNDVDAHLGLSFTLLEMGKFEEGWKEYEWRWKSNQLPPRGLSVPVWNGEQAESATDVLLFYSEQGFGDTLQFMRYAPLLKQKWGGKIVMEVRFPMLRLAKTMKGIDGVIAFGEQLPINMKRCLPMMSAPKIMGTTLNNIPADVPYVFPSHSRVKLWRERLNALPPGLKVGICWAGGARPNAPIANAVDKKRSTTLDEFKPLGMPGVSFVSLQVGSLAKDVQSCPAGMVIGDWTDEIDDYHDSAALIECLDLVISVDTSVIHIAGALGKPVWMLSRFDNCWRWMGRGSDSPWYPSLRQFVQPSNGDWSGMMHNVKRALQQFCLEQRKAA